MPSLSRRCLLMGATAAGVGIARDGAFAASTPSSPLSSARRFFPEDAGAVSPQRVASADLTASGVILWARSRLAC